eukprot:m.362061 g.362061  ORF g.362061 m.362061 type:complete len:161 (-) comp20072_c0_seq1:179-661(-)
MAALIRMATARGLRATVQQTQVFTSMKAAVAARSVAANMCSRWNSSQAQPTVTVVFKDQEGGQQVCHGRIGQTLLDVAIDNDLDLEGACGGTLACSTCHLILDQQYFDMLDEPDEEEMDMLDLAQDLRDTSRLGCQISLTKQLEGITVTFPAGQYDARSF